jgi:hypothetical protein
LPSHRLATEKSAVAEGDKDFQQRKPSHQSWGADWTIKETISEKSDLVAPDNRDYTLRLVIICPGARTAATLQQGWI